MRTLSKRNVCMVVLMVGLCMVPSVLWAGGTVTTSGVTAQTIIDRARNDLNEISTTSSRFFSDVDLLQWTDEAVREIVYKTRCLESGSSLFVIYQNKWEYDITSNFLDVESVLYDSGVTTSDQRIFALDRGDIRTIGRNKERGNPKVFLIWNNKLFVWPIPGPSQSGTTLNAYMITQPSGITSSTSPIETPSYFDLAVVNYVKAKAKFKDNDSINGGFFMKLFYEIINNYMVNVMGKEPETAPPQ